MFLVLDNETQLTSAMVAVSEKRKEIVIAFRASENLWNFVLDAFLIDGTPDAGSNIKIHKGFIIAVMSLYNDVSSMKMCLVSFQYIICNLGRKNSWRFSNVEERIQLIQNCHNRLFSCHVYVALILYSTTKFVL